MADQVIVSSEKTICFDEIVQGRTNSVRVTADGLLYAVDLAMVMTGKDRNDSAQALRRTPENLFSSNKFIERPTKGGGHSTKLVRFNDAIELVMVLPGAGAASARKQFKDVITRYIEGNPTLHAEIRANANSMSPIAQLARGSANALAENETSAGTKRKHRETGGLIESNITADEMAFIKQAFDYQKEALELRFNQDKQPLSLENDDTEYNKMRLQTMMEENKILGQEDQEATQYIKQMETELESLESTWRQDILRTAEQIMAIRVMSGLCTNQQCVTPFCTAHPNVADSDMC
jgi:hypothetical protein